MHTCTMCGRQVADSDGLELTDGRFFCTSGGCQKKFLDGIVATEVIPDIVQSGGRVVLLVDAEAPTSRFTLPVLEEGPAEFCRECELCRRVQIGGRRYRFHYGKKGDATEHGDYQRVGSVRRTCYQIAGRESAWICYQCVSRRRWLSLGLRVTLPVLAGIALALVLGLLGWSGANVVLILAVLIALGVYFVIMPPRGEKETGEYLAIGIKREALNQQGYDAFLTTRQHGKLK